MLSRRAAPAPAPTAAAQDQASPRLPSPPSPPTPACPPGFPSPVFAGRDIALKLFPQLADVPDPDASPVRSVRSSSSSIPDPMEERASLPRRSISASSRPVAEQRSEGLTRKVRFGPLLLAPIQPLPGIHGAPRPCLKTAGGSSVLAPTMDASVARGARQASPHVVSARSETQRAPGRQSRSPSKRNIAGSSSEEWQPVRAPYWWRAVRPSPQHSRARQSTLFTRPPQRRQSPQFTRPTQRRPSVKPNKRICRNCLEKGHPAAECRDPVRCASCRGWRHIARECPSRHRKAVAQLSDCTKTPARRGDDHDRHRSGTTATDTSAGTQRLFRGLARPADKRYDERSDDRRDDRHEDRRGGRDDRDRGRRRAATFIRTQRRCRSLSSTSSGWGSLPLVRGRSPPRSPRALELFHANEAFLLRLTPPRRASVELPPPPPLPKTGPMPKRLFMPRTAVTTVEAAVEAASPKAAPSPAPSQASPMLYQDHAAPSPGEASPTRTPVHISAPTPSPARGPLWAPSPSPPTPLFVPAQDPLLQAPSSTPPRPPTARRKTLAGVTSFAGFPVQRCNPRLKAKQTKMPIAKLAEKVLCHRLGIVAEGEQVTEAAIAKFVLMFDGKLPDIAIAALQALFRLDCDFATAVEDALVQFGGAAAVDHVGDLAPDGSAQA